MLGDALDPLPVAELHRFAAHQFQKRTCQNKSKMHRRINLTDFVEIVDGLLKGEKGWPFLQRLWKFAAPDG